MSEEAVDFNSIKEKYTKLIQLPHPEKDFDIPYPSKEDLREKLVKEANNKINSILFWTNVHKRKEYVENRFQTLYNQLVEEWEEKKRNFIDLELSIRKNEKNRLESILNTDIEHVYTAIEEVLHNITLPVDFSINYEIDNQALYLDLDLPEIEDMPLDKVKTLSNGNISIRQKTLKEQSAEYAQCVCGMSYFFTSLLFNTTPVIDEIYVSAYTQRENPSSGRIEDQYVYSVLFDRERFSLLKFNAIDPIKTLYNFPHNIKISSSYKLETIDITQPLTEETALIFSIAKPRKAKQTEVSITRPQESIEKSIKQTKPTSHNKLNITIPNGYILVEIIENDKTIYYIDSKTYMDLKEYSDGDGKKYIVVKKDIWQKALEEKNRQNEIEKELVLTAQLNNEGIRLEKEGKEEEAICVYEKNIIRKCTARHSYDRLLVLYKKRKDSNNELRIAKIASSIFPQELKYKTRFENLIDRENKGHTLPTEAYIYHSEVKHGDTFEKRILELPEFDFYQNGAQSNVHEVNSKTLEPIWEIQRYFKNLIEAAELAESKKDYNNAAMIYEQIIGENYWMPRPCDRLIKIYAKAKLKNEEIRVIKYGIKYFSELRENRLKYVKALADKYNCTPYLNERINNGNKITYYNGVFELYNPFTIIEKWIERLSKIGIQA